MIPTLAKTELTTSAAASQISGDLFESSSMATQAKVSPARS